MDEVRLTVRIPREVYEAMQRRAKAERRSLNGQIVWEVEACVVDPQRVRAEQVAWVEAQYAVFRRLEGGVRAVGLVEEFLGWLRGR